MSSGPFRAKQKTPRSVSWCCEVTSVVEGHDVERVIARRDVEFGVRGVIAKETFSAVVKHAGQIDESASDVVGDGIVSQMVFSRDKLWTTNKIGQAWKKSQIAAAAR